MSLVRSARRLLLRGAALASGRPPSSRPDSIRRLLIIRPDHVGDVLLSTPALQLLVESLPDVEITLLVGPWSADVAAHGPPVQRIETLRFPGFARAPKGNVLAPYALLERTASRLRRERFDMAVVLRPDHWWGALLALRAGIPMRVGFGLPELVPLLTDTLPFDPTRHAAEQALDLALVAARLAGAAPPRATPTALAFRPSAQERRAAAQWLASRGLDGRRPVVLQPGAGAPVKSWPIDRWAALARVLLGQSLDVVVCGGPGEENLIAGVLALLPPGAAQPAVALPLGQAAALFERSALLIGVDNGAAHLAAAVGTPTVRLYGPADVGRFGPWPPDPARQRALAERALLCLPCGDLLHPPCGALHEPPCLRALRVERVARAAIEVLNAPRP